jgi:Flp pilus assembly protein TadG
MARRRARPDAERGSVCAELVVATPLLLLLVLLVVQFALWQHAVHVADAAAQEGARAARLEGGTAAAGQVEAERFLARFGRTVVTDREVVVRRDAERARVEVRGYATAVVPFLHLPVRAASEGVVERFRPMDPGASP